MSSFQLSIEVEMEEYAWDMRQFKVADPDGYFLRITSEWYMWKMVLKLAGAIIQEGLSLIFVEVIILTKQIVQ